MVTLKNVFKKLSNKLFFTDKKSKVDKKSTEKIGQGYRTRTIKEKLKDMEETNKRTKELVDGYKREWGIF